METIQSGYIFRVPESLSQNTFKCWCVRYTSERVPTGLAKLLGMFASVGCDFLWRAVIFENQEEDWENVLPTSLRFGFNVETHGWNINEPKRVKLKKNHPAKFSQCLLGVRHWRKNSEQSAVPVGHMLQ